ncbi:DUF456 domain-containing protein, partial [Nocardioides sp.]|uniref:DUF456 domain-containing protein n=1 Tax=Nocardioides sp. TaxID=35761 RepID=UPI002ED2CE62
WEGVAVSLLEFAVAVAIAIGLLGILVPILPGALLILGAILVWATELGERTGWIVLAVATLLTLIGAVAKYAVPGRRLKGIGIPSSTQWTGVAFGLVGFFVVPVIGLFLGFVLGVYVAEHRRVGGAAAWPSTKAALRAAGLSILIELATGMLAAATWVAGVVLT